MKKAIYILSMFSLMFVSIMPVAAATVQTGLTSDISGGAAPLVLAKWEANETRIGDASTNAGAQILPSGKYGVNKKISMCAIVTDPDGLADVKNVYADVFYPDNIALGDSHVPLLDQSGLGCGELMQEDSLARLDKMAGIDLFCDKVRAQNNNLPTFDETSGYDEICGETGHLWKDEAAVFCGSKDLSYEDPAGDYTVWAVGQDTNGLKDVLENTLQYLPVTAFETDFNQVAYGNVRLNIHKIISGDLTWSPMNLGKATVRNVGNTRLEMTVNQNDMGLGKTDGVYNVKFDARVGSASAYAKYFPEQTVVLDDELDLSELDEMDFSVLISKFPPTHEGDSYVGTMTLGASMVNHLLCSPTQDDIPQT